MVEEKRKRGRPKKNTVSIPKAEPAKKNEPTVWDWEISGTQRRDDLCIQMLMGIINKQGQIKYDFAKDIFDTATQLAYDFGWMERPKAKKQDLPQIVPEVVADYDKSHEYKAEALANTPADIIRQLREG